MPTVVVMAAGLGSRYGSFKQVDSVGPSGEMLLDYAVFDARGAGFTRVVFVVRRDLAALITARAARFPSDIDVRVVMQEPDSLPAGLSCPPGRSRPWGTVHALLTARSMAEGPLVTINADDFYGRPAYALAMQACKDASLHGHSTVVGMRLDSTLSPHGPVVRGICETSGGWLTRIEEVGGIERRGDGIAGQTASHERRLTGSEVASMNLWVFPPATVDKLADVFSRFVRTHGNEHDAELPLPRAVADLVTAGHVQVRVEQAPGPWFGLTHPQDRERVASSLATLVGEGVYPDALWRR